MHLKGCVQLLGCTSNINKELFLLQEIILNRFCGFRPLADFTVAEEDDAFQYAFRQIFAASFQLINQEFRHLTGIGCAVFVEEDTLEDGFAGNVF